MPPTQRFESLFSMQPDDAKALEKDCFVLKNPNSFYKVDVIENGQFKKMSF